MRLQYSIATASLLLVPWPCVLPAADSPAVGGIEEIVVTAERVNSLAARTPLALTAITGDRLRSSGVSDAWRLSEWVPNLSIVDSGALQITIRGVTSTDATEKGDPSAAFLLDGVYLARPQAQSASFFDVARVEVLRGPQGTLYGRNTTAGVINIISNRPVAKFESAIHAGLGDFGTRQAEAMVNVPINESVALRAAVVYDRRDSYLIAHAGETTTLDPYKDTLSMRLQTLMGFTDRSSWLLKIEYSKFKGLINDTLVRQANFFDLSDPLNPVFEAPGSVQRRLLPFTQAWQSTANNSTWGLHSELQWRFGPLAATYVASFRDFKRSELQQNFDLGAAFGAPSAFKGLFFGDYRQNSQELRFATTAAGLLKGQFGFYYFRERSGIGSYYKDLPFFGLPSYYGFPQDPTINESYAAFAQGTSTLTPQWRVSAGVRWSHDRKSRAGGTVFQVGPLFDPATDLRNLNYAASTSSRVTWRVGLEYDLRATTLLYGSVATGYKAGGFNDGCAAGSSYQGQACNQIRSLETLYYRPETLTAVEAGAKSRLFDNRLDLNIAAFYYAYRNLQLSSVGVFNGGPTQTTLNAGVAGIEGVEVEAAIAPTAQLRMDVAATYLRARYDRYAPGRLVNNAIVAVDYSGRSLDRSPQFTLSAGWIYRLALANGAHIGCGLHSRWSDSFVVTDFGNVVQYPQARYSKTDVTLSYTARAGIWSVEGYAYNLEDEVTLQGVNSFGGAHPGEPRTLGLRFGLVF